ncbi:MAG: dihydropteroate synthase, partial [Verrucomicrobiota bacterium]
NVTPDSFSDGGRYLDTRQAIRRGQQIEEEGADIIDVGGESTRPGAETVDTAEEINRVIPVIEALSSSSSLPISIDTRKSEVASRALAAGASIINDVSGLTYDSTMPLVAENSGAGVIIMHMQGAPRTMQKQPRYDDVLTEILDWLECRAGQLEESGIERDRIALDPGIGFGKTLEHNLKLLAGVKALGNAGRPVVIGASRKSSLGRITGRETNDRLAASLAVLAFCVMNGAHIMRVHDVKESRDVVETLTAIDKYKEQ